MNKRLRLSFAFEVGRPESLKGARFAPGLREAAIIRPAMSSYPKVGQISALDCIASLRILLNVLDCTKFVEGKAAELAPRARFELATLRLTAGQCKNLSALFGVAYDREQHKSHPSIGQLLGNLCRSCGRSHRPLCRYPHSVDCPRIGTVNYPRRGV